jgi:hypothetical protein
MIQLRILAVNLDYSLSCSRISRTLRDINIIKLIKKQQQFDLLLA